MHSAQCTVHIYSKPEIINKPGENAIVYTNNIILTPFSIQWFFCRRRHHHHHRNTNTWSTLHFVGFLCAVAHSFIERFLNSFQCMSFNFGLFVFIHFPCLTLTSIQTELNYFLRFRFILWWFSVEDLCEFFVFTFHCGTSMTMVVFWHKRNCARFRMKFKLLFSLPTKYIELNSEIADVRWLVQPFFKTKLSLFSFYFRFCEYYFWAIERNMIRLNFKLNDFEFRKFN